MAINLDEYHYTLPPEKIALFPSAHRDQSKLLLWQPGQMRHLNFADVTHVLPRESLLIFNDTRVIPARLLFKKETGAEIEIFLLSPIFPSPVVAQTMQASGSSTWKCTIGNIKRWREGTTLVRTNGAIKIEATLTDRQNVHVQFNWSGSIAFASAISLLGETPLPPYLKRSAEPADRERYQTIYSRHDGAVAAPTAGLHFTNTVLALLEEKGIEKEFITLHVGAGTFMPIKEKDASHHQMHAEQIIITRSNLISMMKHRFITPVGTTSMRTLESIYWYGRNLLYDSEAPFNITQFEPYRKTQELPSRRDALTAILASMDRHETNSLAGETSIYIIPGYTFRMCNALITNFHQPGSTLILLVAAFIGHEWKQVYQAALENNYRFLSYGDSSLLMPQATSFPPTD
jgi:S-adenosylmethionine:tRNA ribosyltransferase-isomerase